MSLPSIASVLRVKSEFPAYDCVIGVGHPLNFTACSSDAVCFRPSAVLPVMSIFSVDMLLPPLGVFGVGQLASQTSRPNNEFSGTFGQNDPSFPSRVVGVGHEVETLADVRGADARSAEIDRPDGEARCFQVSVNKVEPTEAILACNLFAKDCARSALLDKVEPVRPEVPLVRKPCSFACRAERLTRAGSSPDRAIIGPTGSTQGVGPDANTGKEVALSKCRKFSWNDIFYAPLVHFARSKVALFDQLSQPCRSLWVVFVIVDGHNAPMSFRPSLARLT